MEHKKEDLDGDIELSVVLPNTSIVSFTVKRRLPLMDLLVLVSSKHHLKPSEHMIQAVSESNTIVRSTPNTPVGALKARYIQILKKHVMEEPQPAPPVAPPRRNALPNISSTLPPKHKPDVKSLDPQKLLLSFRLLVHLPNNQLHVMRVTPDMTISDILVTVQDAKNLNIKNFSIRNKNNPQIELDFNNTLAHYQIKELVLERKAPPVPLTQSRTSLQQTEPSTSTFKSGLRSFFTNLKLSSGKNRHKLSLREGQIKQPAVQKKVQNIFYKDPTLTPREANQAVITPINRPKPPPRKRHAPPPPVQQIKDIEIVSSELTNKSEVGNGVITRDTLPVLPTSEYFENHIQRDSGTNESQKKQLVRQLAVVSVDFSTESAKEENPKIVLNETISDEHSGTHVNMSAVNNHIKSVSQSISQVILHSEESNNVNDGESTSYTMENASKIEESGNNCVNIEPYEKHPRPILEKTPNTEIICTAPSFIHDTKSSGVSEQMTENQCLHRLEMEIKALNLFKENAEKTDQINIIGGSPEIDKYTKLQVVSNMSSTNFGSNDVETNQSTKYLANKMETKIEESQNINLQKSVTDYGIEKNELENKNLENRNKSIIDNHVEKEKLANEYLQNAETVMINLIKEKQLLNEDVKNIEKADIMNINEKNSLKNDNQNNEQIMEKNIIKTAKLQNVNIQKSITDKLIKQNDTQNDNREETINSVTSNFVKGHRNGIENVHYKSTCETSQLATSVTNVGIDNDKNQGGVCGTNSLTPLSIKQKNVNDKGNFINDDKIPLSKASSDLNVHKVSSHTPRFMLTSWSSDKVPKVIRIADDTTHGSSAYSQSTTSASTTSLDKQQIAEKTLSEESLQSEIEKSFIRPVVVSVIRKDPNCSSSKINNQNGNMEKVHHEISIESDKEKTITSKSTSSYTTKAISTPPKIQSWELVNAIEKMLKKTSDNRSDNSFRNLENTQSGNEGSKYFNKIPFELFTYISQTGKPSYFQIIAQNEYIRSKIPLELSEQSKRSSNESLPLLNDYGSGSHDKKG